MRAHILDRLRQLVFSFGKLSRAAPAAGADGKLAGDDK
jgi:hypothetical protein